MGSFTCDCGSQVSFSGSPSKVSCTACGATYEKTGGNPGSPEQLSYFLGGLAAGMGIGALLTASIIRIVAPPKPAF